MPAFVNFSMKKRTYSSIYTQLQVQINLHKHLNGSAYRKHGAKEMLNKNSCYLYNDAIY